MPYLMLAAVVVGVLVAAVPMLVRRDRRRDEVARFHRARAMTTAWARAGAPRLIVPEATDEADDADEADVVDEPQRQTVQV